MDINALLQQKDAPKWMHHSCSYLSLMGSQAYGVSEDKSDIDLYGFCIPPKELIFPHLAGEIPGFGTQKQRFNQWEKHHITQPNSNTVCDISVYSIVKYFQLVMDNNPNMVDSLFTRDNHVMLSSNISDMVREKRRMFLHKGAFHRFRGYAYAQMDKIKNKKPINEKRAELVSAYGYDTKFGYHVVRLALECEDILNNGDLDLMKHSTLLRAVRHGEWPLERLEQFLTQMDISLQDSYNNSKLPHSPPEDEIKELLLNCIEAYHGSVSQELVIGVNKNLLHDLKNLIGVYESYGFTE